MQAFFEYQPARMARPSSTALEQFDSAEGCRRPRNEVRRAWTSGRQRTTCWPIHSLKGYRTLRWGRNLDLIITDERSYRSEDPSGAGRKPTALGSRGVLLSWLPRS